MKVLLVCFVFTLLASSSISVLIESPGQTDFTIASAEQADVADAAINYNEDEIHAEKSIEEEEEIAASSYSASPNYSGPSHSGAVYSEPSPSNIASSPRHSRPSYSDHSYSVPAMKYFRWSAPSKGHSATFYGGFRPTDSHMPSYITHSPSYSGPSYSTHSYSVPARKYFRWSAPSKGHSAKSYGGYRPAGIDGIHVPSYISSSPSYTFTSYEAPSYSAPSYFAPSYASPAPVYSGLALIYPAPAVRCGSNLGCQRVGSGRCGSYSSSNSAPSYSAPAYLHLLTQHRSISIQKF